MSRQVVTLIGFLALVLCAVSHAQAVDTLRIGDGAGLPGTTGNPVSIELVNDGPRAGVLFKLDDLPDSLVLTGVSTTSRTTDMYVDYADVEGDARVIILSLDGGDLISAGTGPVVELLFDVADTISGPFEVVTLSPYDVQVADSSNAPVSVDAAPGEFVIGDPTLAGNPDQPGLQCQELSAHPNPFNPSVTIGFSVEEPNRRVTVRVFNAGGRAVRTLVDRKMAAGHHEVVWDGTDSAGMKVASGIYFCVLESEHARQAEPLVLLK